MLILYLGVRVLLSFSFSTKMFSDTFVSLSVVCVSMLIIAFTLGKFHLVIVILNGSSCLLLGALVVLLATKRKGKEINMCK